MITEQSRAEQSRAEQSSKLAWYSKIPHACSYVSFSLVLNLLFILFFTNGLFAKATVGNFYVSPNTVTSGIDAVVTASAYSNTNAFVYVSKNTLVAGMRNLHVATTRTKNTTFYVKEKTVFHAEKNTHVKVVYISDTKAVYKNEKVVTAFKKPTLQLQQTKQAQLQVKPNHKLPFRVGSFNFFGNDVAIAINYIAQNAKINTTFKNKTSYIVCNAVSITHNNSTSNKSFNNFSYKTSKHKLHILKINFGRPSPVV